MKLQKYACRIFAVMLIIVTSSCVDNNYRIDEVSTEVTIASGKTTLPIGYLENKTLGDLLARIEGLSVDADGNYSFSISGEGESVKIDGIQNSFSVPAAQNKFNIDCPSFSLDAAGVTVNEENPINVDLDSSLPSTSGTLPESLVAYMPNIVGTFSKTIGGDDMHLLFDVPEQVENINKIMFKDIESGHKGAPMHLTLDLNGLAGINGGGDVNFNVTLNGGKFRVLDAEGNLLFEGNEYESTYTVEAGAEEVSFVMYVESIENTTSLNDKHQLDIPLELICNVEFDLDVKAGDFDLGADPLFKLNADFEFGDAEIALSEALKIDEDYEVGEEVTEEVQFVSFGRRAILTLRQTLASKILELEKDSLYHKYKDMEGTIIAAEVYQIWKKEILLLDDEGNELLLPKSEQIPSDFYRKGDTVRAVVLRVDNFNNNPKIILSLLYNFFHVLLTSNCCIDLTKLCARRICNYFCQCCFSSSWSTCDN